jgi:hypothetical protein
MAGYLARKELSCGTLDPLYVRGLILTQGRTTAAIVLADVLLFSAERAAALRRRIGKALKIAPGSVMIAATHTHSGPLVDTGPFDFSGTREDARMKKFQLQMERVCFQAAVSAALRRQPVHASFSRTMIRGVASDRNRPRSARSQPLVLFRFQGRRRVALLAVYGCHPTVLGAANCLLSGDLHGRVASQLERSVDVALLANGAAGNVSTRFTRRNQSPAELGRLASSVVKQVRLGRLAPLPERGISLRTAIVRLPLRNLRASALPASASRRAGRLQTVAREGEIVRSHLLRSPVFRKKTLAVPISALRIGAVTLVALPFEIFSATGTFLWRKKVFPLCYTNGYWGYVPDSSAKSGDYEVISSPFPIAADAKLRRAILALARELAR